MTDPKEAAMSQAPRCAECKAKRISVQVEWATPDYQINVYECPACKTVLRLVEPRHPDPTYH
jgi:hypothetical protein